MSVIEVAVDHSPHGGQIRVQVLDSAVGLASASADFEAGPLLPAGTQLATVDASRTARLWPL